MPDARYRVEMLDGMPVVAAPAAIDLTTTDELRGLTAQLSRGMARPVVDASELSFADSIALRPLMLAALT